MSKKRDSHDVQAEHEAAHKAHTEAVHANAAYAPPPALAVGEPTRLIDIDIYRYGFVRSDVWQDHGVTSVRRVTLDEAGARKLLHDLLGAFV